jgi:hypothetical protein
LKPDIIDINVPLGRGDAKCMIRVILIDVWQKRWDGVGRVGRDFGDVGGSIRS